MLQNKKFIVDIFLGVVLFNQQSKTQSYSACTTISEEKEANPHIGEARAKQWLLFLPEFFW